MKYKLKYQHSIIIVLFLVALFLGLSLSLPGNTQILTHESKEITPKQQTMNLTVQEFKKEIESGKYTVIDIRTTPELEYTGTITNNPLNFDIYQEKFTTQIGELDKTKAYAIYCNSGNRSKTALQYMIRQGFTNVIELNYGIQAWMSEGGKTESYSN